jgi:hypothetical protein
MATAKCFDTLNVGNQANSDGAQSCLSLVGFPCALTLAHVDAFRQK